MPTPRPRMLLAAIPLLLPACGPSPVPASGGGPESQADSAAVSQSALDTLAPDRLRIHSLTRITKEIDASGGAVTQLACHIELKDKFGHNVKALGRLRIELYHPTTAEPGGAMIETQDQVWEIDLRDPDRNALLYDDLVTRTYALRLGGLPDWVVRWNSTPPGATAGGGGEPWVTLKATFNAVDYRGRERRLESTYRLQR